MPQRKSGIKELRKNRKNKLLNLDIKTNLKKSIKSFLIAVEAKNKEEASNCLKIVYKKIDKAAKSNIIHKNTAARRKSYYSKKLKQLTGE